MNKGEFTAKAQEEFKARNIELSDTAAAKLVDAVFDTLQTTLAGGEAITIKAQKTVGFKVGKGLKTAVN